MPRPDSVLNDVNSLINLLDSAGISGDKAVLKCDTLSEATTILLKLRTRLRDEAAPTKLVGLLSEYFREFVKDNWSGSDQSADVEVLAARAVWYLQDLGALNLEPGRGL